MTDQSRVSILSMSRSQSAAPSSAKLTPMFEQYLSVKHEYPDALLFYRMGDFYELFFEDAKVAARELQIALTSRNPNADVKVPMCGVPHHAMMQYAAKLLEKGFAIAVCDQVEDPKQAKGLVKRAVTRVLTPGTAVEDDTLQAGTNNFLAALYWDAEKSKGGLAWADASTGEWSGLQTHKESDLWQWLAKLEPRELLVPDNRETPRQASDCGARVNRLSSRAFFDLAGGRKKVLEIQKAADLKVLDLEDKNELTRACGALAAYLQHTQMQDDVQLGQFRILQMQRQLILDEVTERNLELFRTLDGRKGPGTLLHAIDQTRTPMGGRLLQHRLRNPWRDLKPVQECLDATAFFAANDALRNEVREHLDCVYDMERLSTRIFLNRASPKDFIALRTSLSRLPALRTCLANHAGDSAPKQLAALLRNWDDLEEYCALLHNALQDAPPPVITEGGLFKKGYDPILDDCLELTQDGQGKLEQLLEHTREQTGLAKLKLGSNRVFGYYFELPRSMSEQVPYDFERRQTLANAERYVTPALKELESRLFAASDEQNKLEYELFLKLRDSVAQGRPRFLFMADAVAALDYWQGLAETARRKEWSRPEPHTGLDMEITAGRHPVVEAMQSAADFIPNDLHMGDEARLLIITGPNMAGKSTVLRQAAIICILAQMGSFVPARTARIGLADRIFSRVGASDNLARGQSTFMVEMTETARILRQAGKRSLIILDEIGRGTSTFDGLSLAWAVAEDLASRAGGVRTLFATHYHELTALEAQLPGVRNFNVAVKEWGGDIVFLRRMVPGPSDRSYGVEVARLAGVPQSVVQRAKEVLAELEQSREGTKKFTPPATVGTMLPGLEPEPVTHTPGTPEPADLLLQELAAADPDRLTPLQALSLIQRWRQEYGNYGNKGQI